MREPSSWRPRSIAGRMPAPGKRLVRGRRACPTSGADRPGARPLNVYSSPTNRRSSTPTSAAFRSASQAATIELSSSLPV